MNETILVVDDDREIVEAVKIRLEKEGFLVKTAYDGLEALEVVAEEKDLKLIIIEASYFSWHSKNINLFKQ